MVTEQRTSPEMRAAARERARLRDEKGFEYTAVEVGTVAALCDDADALAGARAECQRLRTALAFYADPANWEPFDFYWIGDAEEAGPPAVSDLGERARVALAEAKEGNRG